MSGEEEAVTVAEWFGTGVMDLPSTELVADADGGGGGGLTRFRDIWLTSLFDLAKSMSRFELGLSNNS